MKNYSMFNYNYLFSDHFAQTSNQAKLYYIKLNFYANNGFVSNPLQILDSLGYDRSVLNELIAAGEILKLEDRCEVFIAAYFIHNKGMQTYSWKATPYYIYWRDKLFIKKNGVATFTPQVEEEPMPKKDPLDKIIVAEKKPSASDPEPQDCNIDFSYLANENARF